MRRRGSPFVCPGYAIDVVRDCGRQRTQQEWMQGQAGHDKAGPVRGKSMLLRILDRLEEILIATLMALATSIIFIAVMHRYLVGIPFLYPILFPINLSWAQELCIYMFVWVAKFGAAYGVRTGIHVGVDVVVNQLKSPWRNAVVLFGLFCGAFFTAVIGTMGAKFVDRADVHRPGLARPRDPELVRLSLHSARLLSDVLPLPAGRVWLLAHRRTAAS